MRLRKNRQFQLHKNKYMLPLGKLAASMAWIEHVVNVAIAQLCLSIRDENMFVMLSEINSMPTRLRILQTLSSKTLNKKDNARMRKYISEITRLQTRRNDYVHSSWVFYSSIHPPFISKLKRGEVAPTAPTTVELAELKRLVKDSQKCGRWFDLFIRQAVVPAAKRKLYAYIQQESAQIQGRTR